MDVKIYPPPSISGSAFSLQWYDLEITQINFNLTQKIEEYNITDNNRALVRGYVHSTSTMSFNGVISADSGIPGATLEEKKENLMEAASSWWTWGNQINRTECARIDWRGWVQYMMIERLAIEKTAGDEDAYDYELVVFIHEGHD